MKARLSLSRVWQVSLLTGLGLVAAISGERPALAAEGETGVFSKMIVERGSVTLDLDTRKLAGEGGRQELRFDAVPFSFLTVLVFDDEVRGPQPGSMTLVARGEAASLPARLAASYRQLAVENLGWGGDFDLVVRDARNGFVFFDVEGQQFEYEPSGRLLRIHGGRLLLSEAFASALGRPRAAGSVVGEISIEATMVAIEITRMADGDVVSDVLPAISNPDAGTVPGPDVIVGDLSGLAQFGQAAGTQVGLAVGTDSCNAGTVDLNWFSLPSNDHPVIPQNLYRMSGGPTNDLRFEQIGQSNVKHAFTALTENICGFGCNNVGGTHLGSGCSDPYVASLNAGPNLGSRAWINPFTGAYPRGDSSTPPNTHTGHSHQGPSHRILTEVADLNTSLNAGATYYAEGQYITPHEYVWCQGHPGECNMNNNVSYRRFNVSGTTCVPPAQGCYSFSPVGSTQRTQPAVAAWTGATLVPFQPDPGNDGVGTVAYKVTNPSPGVWHYEYAIYNQNIGRAIQSFSIPVKAGANITNAGFHAPPQHPGWAADGTVGNTGYSSAAWPVQVSPGSVKWSSETFDDNPNANALRWGTLYNFRFDSTIPPVPVRATIGFFSTGAPIQVTVKGPGAHAPIDFDANAVSDIVLYRFGAWFTFTPPAGIGPTSE